MKIFIIIILGLAVLVSIFFAGVKFSQAPFVGDVLPEEGVEENGADGETGVKENAEEIKIDASAMTDGQKRLLGILGIDAENFVLTPEMVACSEAKLGKVRVAEIQNGATPSVLEGISLLACYKK